MAEEEGFPEIAEHFKAIASIEKHHMERFQRYLDRIKAGTLWKRDKAITWKCLVCGYEGLWARSPKYVPPATTHISITCRWIWSNLFRR